MNYLSREQSRFENIPITVNLLRGFFNGLNDFFSELNSAEQSEFKQIINANLTENIDIFFFSFNYTNTLDKCVNTASKETLSSWNVKGNTYRAKINSSVLHLHGTLDKFPIIGVSDINDIANDKFRENPDICSLLLKTNAIDDIGEYWYKDAKMVIDNSRIVCVFGMSIGKTDSFWWSYLTEWLKKDNSHKLVIFWYDASYTNMRSRYKYRLTTRKVKKQFVSYSGLTDEEKETLFSQIYVVINTNTVLKTDIEIDKKIENSKS